ncbi:contractile injection system protein, VgrG/Pvc8 family [Kosakonia cowanii]|uniref:contractile injection system protein, VgrG/Pvc8 family n=1 Tax=Kosakonia cowanii TaxID=208223 RepID=UPI003981BABC
MRIFQNKRYRKLLKPCLLNIWDYSVQYQESSFDFISRLMELEGIASTSGMSVTPGLYSLDDYDFRKPGHALMARRRRKWWGRRLKVSGPIAMVA